MEAKSQHTLTINQIEKICTCFVMKIASDVQGKDVYLRNSIAKTVSFLKTIDLLFNIEKYNEGWILYRSLIDRLVYLYYLTENDNFTEFDEWTFVKLFELRSNAKADERFKSLLKNPKFKTLKEDIKSYKEFKNRLNWVKPKPLDILKSKELDFIYKFGYDYASMHTHPMSWDGSKEFHNLTGLKPNPHDFNEESILLQNSLIISSVIFQEIVENLSIEIPKYFIKYLQEYQKLTLGMDNRFSLIFTETFENFKNDAKY